MINVHVYDERAVSGQNFMGHLVISIVSPGREHPKMEGTNIHKFQFHDVTEEYFLENQNRVIRPMEKEIAASIAQIALDNRDCDRWIIHCEAGISRSPGVAIGLAKHIALQPGIKRLKEMFQCYNKYVAQLIEEELAKKIEEIGKELHHGMEGDGGL